MGFDIPLTAVTFGTCIAMYTDIRARKVYNALTFPMLFTGLVYQAINGGWGGFQDGFVGAAVGFCILLFPFILGLMGGGDLKLLAAVGAWLGFETILVVALIGCLLTGVYSMVVIYRRGGMQAAMRNLMMSYYRVQMISQTHDIPEGDTIAERAEDPVERSKLIPFTILLGLGILGSIAVRAING